MGFVSGWLERLKRLFWWRTTPSRTGELERRSFDDDPPYLGGGAAYVGGMPEGAPAVVRRAAVPGGEAGGREDSGDSELLSEAGSLVGVLLVDGTDHEPEQVRELSADVPSAGVSSAGESTIAGAALVAEQPDTHDWGGNTVTDIPQAESSYDGGFQSDAGASDGGGASGDF